MLPEALFSFSISGSIFANEKSWLPYIVDIPVMTRIESYQRY
jgi:hypothetical protein